MEKAPRLTFQKPITYHPKVKTGNWCEEQCAYKRDNFKHKSEYLHSFTEKPLTTNAKTVMWDIILNSEGMDTGICPLRTTDSLPNFHDNFSTSYNLSYGHFPKIAPPIVENEPPKIRRFGVARPVHELIESYGNIGDYGLGNAKREIWKCEATRRRTRNSTIYEADYTQPKQEDYKFQRWNRVKAIPLRWADTYPPMPPDHPKLSDCNPLSWKCREFKKKH